MKETGEFIVDCGITIQNIDGELLPEIGCHIYKKYWRRGFDTEAVMKLTANTIIKLFIDAIGQDAFKDFYDYNKLYL